MPESTSPVTLMSSWRISGGMGKQRMSLAINNGQKGNMFTQLRLASTDLNIPTSKEEQEEYLRWKQEREQIDRERVARHKNAKGQWRRAWDVDKADSMFLDKSGGEWLPSNRGGRNSRRGQNRTSSDSKGQMRRGKAKEAKNVQAMGSKAKGKDRLTGRARRWESSEDGNAQDSEATLEEFLEELDALTEMVDERKVEDKKAKAPYSRL
uniref:Uncharacterized protein n=1 Tax=Knipowitschia caucasica TaxID=637954 RepID=A0AAV2JEA8_KNICA